MIQAQAATGQHSERAQYASTFWTLLFFIVVIGLLVDGWQNRIYNDINAEQGAGYALGIIGGAMMLLLLLYPLRKRLKALRFMGSVKHWFRLHMMFGVLGPTAVLYHANFQLGSLNSNVALLCMLIVASSGLLGRYFYAKIHHGLYGRQATLQELRDGLHDQHDQLSHGFAWLPEIQPSLARYETEVMAAPGGLLNSLARVLRLTFSTRATRYRLLRQARTAIAATDLTPVERQRERKRLRQYLAGYFAAVRRTAEFTCYARLFALWHVLHLPLFVMMLLTGIIHVIYVHMY